jgi:hypothetical protein
MQADSSGALRTRATQRPSPDPELKGSTRCSRTILTSGPTNGFYMRKLDRACLREKAISIRSSVSWIDTFKTPNGGLYVPFIDDLGRFSGRQLCLWSADPRSLISTVVATILRRIVRYARRHNKNSVVEKRLHTLCGAAAYYAFTKNSYFWDRVLFFSRNLEKYGDSIHRIRLLFVSRWDDNKRFVISQVCFQTYWLLFRAKRPRDKSLFYKQRTGRKSRWRLPNRVPDRTSITNVVRTIAYAMGRAAYMRGTGTLALASSVGTTSFSEPPKG